MLDAAAGRVAAGATVELRPSGSSMVPLIRSRQRVTIAPVDPANLEVGDIVLARVAGTVYLHLVSAVDQARKRVQISNNRGRVNGSTSHDRVFGICVAVEDVPRPGADGKAVATASPAWSTGPIASRIGSFMRQSTPSSTRACSSSVLTLSRAKDELRASVRASSPSRW